MLNNHKKINYPARIIAILKDGVWLVSKDNHNHELDPDMCKLMTSHRNLSIEMKKHLEASNIAEIRPCQSIRLIEV